MQLVVQSHLLTLVFFQGKHEYQARQNGENEETEKSWHSAKYIVFR